MTTNNPESILKKYWGYDAFRPLQKEIINSVLSGRDTLALMPTGGGKSITYQVSALAKEGICIVVTPLISLMKDQVDALRKRKILALAIHSGYTFREIDVILDNCIYGDYKFLYVSPERLATAIFRQRFAKMNVNLIAVDEAHCISQWGYDFRPLYLEIAKIREIQPDVPVLAVTATATQIVADDIMNKLEFSTPNLFSMSFERANISYIIRNTEDKFEHSLRILSSVGGSGIIYCRSRGRCEEVAEKLKNAGVSADFYHAGLSSKIRSLKQDSWLKNQVQVIVATNAFGMGIDKSDVRFVIHYEIPSNLEAYYQEAGRAGRDLKESFAVLLCEKNDLNIVAQRVVNEFPKVSDIKEIYHSLFNYLAIAIGDGKDAVNDFNIYDFCAKFKHFSIMVIASIKILQLNGYMTLTDELDNPTRIMFKVSREELYRIEMMHSDLENFIKLLMRAYTGTFSALTKIDEEYLASISGYMVEQITNMLLRLSRLRVMTYIPRRRTPLLILHEERLPIDNLYISPQSYALRKNIAETRVLSMVNYVTQIDKCRSVILREYFGEKDATECGKCDVCRKKGTKRTEKDFASLESKILELIERGITEVHEIPRHIKCDKKLTASVIRNMVEKGTISLDEKGEITTINKSISVKEEL
ncbi:MAG: ATP-dependent DNA helicase RecQ [Rikenellaceae bacterium]